MQALNTGESTDALREDVQATIDFINAHILNDVEGLRPGKVQALRDAVQAAQALVDNPEATADELKAANKAMTKAAQELWEIVFKAELNALIEAANGYLDGDYTAESLEALQTAIESAQAVADNDDATTAEVTEAITNLSNAIAGLDSRKLDTRALEYEIELVSAMAENIGNYVPSTVEGLQEKLDAAKAALENATTQAEIDEATKSLREARLCARTLADKAALFAAVHNAALLNLDLYTADSAKRVRSLLDQAQEVLNDPEVTQEDVDTITASLNRAVSRLEARPQSDTENGKPMTDPARDEQAASSLSAESDTATSADHLGWIGLLLTCAAVLLCIRKRSTR